MSELPPGFVLDGAAAAPQPHDLPDGFEVDAAPAVTLAPRAAEGGWANLHWPTMPSFSSVAQGVVNGAQGQADELMRLDPAKPTLSKMARDTVSGLRGGGQLVDEAMQGTLDPTSENTAGRAFVATVMSPFSPVTAGSTMARAGANLAAKPIEQGAGALGIGLTAGQRTADPALLSTENAMLGGAMGEGAQRVAQTSAARQRDEIAAAKGVIGDAAGRGQAAIERPADAGDAVAQGVQQVAADAKAEIGRRYDAVRDEPGSLDTRFFTGHAESGTTLPAVPGSVQSDFAAPLSKRITDSLVKRADPVIIDRDITPAAHRALSVLDGIDNLRLGSIGQPGAADEVVGINLRGVDQARRKLAAYGRAASDLPDKRAVGAMIGEFDGQVQDAMERGLFSGSDTALEKLKDARAAFSSYQKTFKPQGAGDDVGKAMQMIVKGDRTPEEVANYLYGGTKVGASGRSIRVADRLKDVLGEGSPEWAAVRQGAWQRALGPMESGPKRAADRILDFVQGDGRGLATRLFSDGERGEMTKLANVLKAISAQPGTVNPSNSGNRLAGLARQSVSAIGAMLGAHFQGATGAAAGFIGGKGLEALSGARNAAQARQLFSGQVPQTIGGRLRQAGVSAGAPVASRLVADGVSGAQSLAVGIPFGPGPVPIRADDQHQPSQRLR